jgi:predicted DsbA family dithiol-disulfide isomerase
MMPISIAIHSDVICPWCWIGKRRLEQALAVLPAGSATISWHPYQLNPGMPIEGMPRAEYRRRKFGSAEYAQALDARVTAVAAEVGLAFDLSGQARTPNTVLAHRLIWWAGRHARQDALVEAMFSAYFSAGCDVGDPAVLVRLASTVGLNDGLVTGFLASEEGQAEVLSEDQAIRQQGVSGVPLFIINGTERISGAQPVAVFSAALSQAVELRPEDGVTCDGDGCER